MSVRAERPVLSIIEGMAKPLEGTALQVHETVPQGLVTERAGGPTVMADDIFLTQILNFNNRHKILLITHTKIHEKILFLTTNPH